MRNTRRKPTRVQLKERQQRRRQHLAFVQECTARLKAKKAALELARPRAIEMYGPEPAEGFTENQLDTALWTLEMDEELANEMAP